MLSLAKKQKNNNVTVIFCVIKSLDIMCESQTTTVVETEVTVMVVIQ